VSSIADVLREIGVTASSSKLGGIFYHHVSRRIDRILIPLTRGRLAMGPPGRTVLITTTGARTGRPRVVSLAFGWDGDDMILVASKGGAAEHPSWYHNLKTHPRVRIQYRAGIEERVAREATGAERDALYARMVQDFANFAAYEKRAAAASGRKIPVVVLEPIRRSEET
jgi:deazaflavin-dependent oxidoreductase (nitroreductase family)